MDSDTLDSQWMEIYVFYIQFGKLKHAIEQVRTLINKSAQENIRIK